jgi:CRISPR-associated protein Csm5
MAVYNLLVRTLTPVHIGDGNVLRLDFDFAVHGGRTYRLNEDAILEAKESQWLAARNTYPLPGRMLTGDGDFQNQAFFRYTLRNAPRSGKTDAELRAFIKDAYDRPYLPGSSLKGAFRTALAWTGWKEIKPRLDRQAIGRSRSWAAQPLERQLFGRDPNHDLLRALHVTDCAGPQKPGEGLIVVNAQVVTRKGAGSPVELEALQGDITLRGSLTIDETLFGPMAEKELRLGNRRHWLTELMARAQAHSQARIEELAEWFERAEGGEAVAGFYRDLQKAKVGANSAVMQIGWGAGWDGKTLWTHLQTDAGLFEQIVSDFRLHKASRGAPPRKAGDPFPRSKRVTMSKGRMATPLGWVLVGLK